MGLQDKTLPMAASLPEMGRKVPARWQLAREALKKTGTACPWNEFLRQSIDSLLRNAPAAQRMPVEEFLAGFVEMKSDLSSVRALLIRQHGEAVGRFDKLDAGTQRILSKVDDAFSQLMQALTDEAPGHHGSPSYSRSVETPQSSTTGLPGVQGRGVSPHSRLIHPSPTPVLHA